ncbi:MAG: N-acetyl-alpha-D-glucosaminyl L-malate synthase BshA, partial [Myxococcales bacterium]
CHRVHLRSTARPSRSLPDCDRLRFHAIAVPEYPLFEHAPYDLAVAGRVVDVVRQHRLDVVQVHYAVPHAASAFLARQVLGSEAPRFVTSLHGTDVTGIGADPAYREVNAFAIAASDGVSAPSEFLRREAHARLGLQASVDIEVIPNFVDTARFAPPARRERARLARLFPDADESGPVLFHVSNFRPVKRVGDLLEVLRRLRRGVAARLVLVGDGPERAATEQQARLMGLEGAVAFLGRRSDFVDYLQQADAFLLPSATESFGVAALEAMSCGVPVFGYAVGGLPELVGEGAGRLVPAYDVDALAAAVDAVVQDDAQQRRMAGAARALAVARFEREPALDHYERWFRRIVSTAGEAR